MSDDVWPSEAIPDEDHLYFHIHCMWIRNGRVAPGFFKNRPDEDTGAMSTDWCKYAKPRETQKRSGKEHLKGVGRFHVGSVREIGKYTADQQIVEHTPVQNDSELPDNRAHTDVRGPKEKGELKVQVMLSDLCSLILDPECPDDPACQNHRKAKRG